ncbi:mechanosensitive ion channel [Pseudolysinimonas kribbensis]|uniref:Mechanosensitive ion channel protein MscS n=1 Tax=Pseudolysinimonas kribbensis TaxID=433641 RepID=A0ABQ6K706_9MICO|nr:mechanosensitive ion channel domain-containing protein [Pseudolysinimonas kribbensis]GMA96433.1 mechanosensitive ion channel protein MscS [Pseudolysinimonas kribbensis]
MGGWSAFWEQVGVFFTSAWGRPVQVALIVVLAIVARLVLHFVIRRFVERVISGAKKKAGVDDTTAIAASPLAAMRVVQRSRALGGVLSSIVTTLVVIVAVVWIVSVAAPQAAGAFSLITAALGAGLGFGAQNIVKDVLNGLFMVAEDQLGVGDVIDTGFATGVVEQVGIRITQVRDVNGTLWYVRNGEILRVGNLSQGWARVIIDLAVPYDSDVELVQQKLLEAATAFAGESKWKRLVIEKPEIWGIESVSAEAIVIRLVVKVRSGTKDQVARALRPRLKIAIDELGVTLPPLNSIALRPTPGGQLPGGRPAPKPPTTSPAGAPAKPSSSNGGRAG